MIEYNKPAETVIYSYSGVIPSVALKSLLASPYTITPTITDGYIQLVKFTIFLSVRTGFGQPTDFLLQVQNSAGLALGVAETGSNWLTEPEGYIWEINPIRPVVVASTPQNLYGLNNIINSVPTSNTVLRLSADSNDPARELTDAKYTVLYTKYTI